jgi:parvulin-like peptidyl-prolyl isomerase
MLRLPITIAVLLFAGSAWAQKAGAPVAVVNGEPIPRSEFDAAMNQRPLAATPLSADQKKLLEQEIVSALIDDLLFKQFLNKSAPPVAKAEIDKQLAGLDAALASRKRSLADYCRETHQSPEQIHSSLTQMLQWSAYSASKVTDADIRQYYLDNKPLFDKATVRVSHIVIRWPATATAADREAATKRLADLRHDIAAGRITLSEAAAKYSQCPSASRNGDLGFISRKWMMEETFAKAAFALDVGALSEVVTTEFGCHLIQVTEKRPGEPSNFADPRVQEETRECLLEEMRQKLLAELRAKGKVEVKLNK